MHIVHTESSCGWGGQELRILNEAKGLKARGHKISLICPEESNIFKVAPDFGLTPIALPIKRKNLTGLFALMKWLWDNRQDISVINTHSSTDSWLVAIACCLLPAVLPIVRTRHVSSPINKKKSTFWLYQKAAKHIAVTGEPLREQLARDNGFDLESMTSVPTGIDLERFTPGMADITLSQPYQGKFVLGILATLRSWKGHSYLLEAIDDLQKKCPDLHLLIVGDGPQRDNLELQVDKLGLQDVVSFVGNQSNPEQWLRVMDLFILPSYGDEGVSQAVMQAMATRLPVITTDVGGMRDAVQDRETGLLVETKSTPAIYDAVLELYQDEPLRDALADAGYERSQRLFGKPVMLDRMEKIFRTYSVR
jgi:glycosyltransferase involved in cell wall biosynthesis